MVDAGEWAAIEHLVERLKKSYPEVSPDTIVTVVHHNHARFGGRPIRDFVPLFVERGSKRQLSQVGA